MKKQLVAPLRLALLIPVCLFPASMGFAATATTTFQVLASVINACIVTATPLNFGVYNPTLPGETTSTSTITTTCTIGTSYTVGLNEGTGTGATVTTRAMSGVTVPANQLPYGLYQDLAHTLNWGNTPGTDTPPAVIATGVPENKTVFGRILPGNYVPVDSYLDTITVTVTY